MTIQEKINKVKTEALEAFNKDDPALARKYIHELQKLDRELYSEEAGVLSKIKS